ncbi:MAG TPA: lysine-sensitive aspartokinase 3 [Bryobacteraceae bacterium]|nr:lysine-sensitive aspartokinase 3 [Bryobacteraceae bacterium]
MIVMKFGGSSVESAEAIQRVAGIVRERLERLPVVVVSAMGKTTNKLLAIANEAANGNTTQALELLSELEQYHLSEAGQIASPEALPKLERIVGGLFREIQVVVRNLCLNGGLSARAIDLVSSYGECLSSVIVTFALEHAGAPAVHVDSREVIVTDSRHTQAAPLFAQTYARLKARVAPLAEAKVVVMGGFIGRNEEGAVTTLGRGGGDFSAAIVGAGIDAEEIQIWTDVDGMLTADPTILCGGHRVKTISFAEAAELAYFGAKVLHPATVVPAVEKNIPVLILNSRRPGADGTRIVAQAVQCSNIAKSIACKKNITLLNIHSTRMLMAYGFLRRIFEVFDRYETPVDMVATSEVSVSLTIDNAARLSEICTELEHFAEVSIEKEQAIVCLVGDNIRYTPGVASRVFQALESINIRMISQGASLLNLSVVVAQEDLKTAVEHLHAQFFSNPDPAVFG